MKVIIRLSAICFVILWGLSSCNKILDVATPVNQITEQNVFSNAGTIQSAVTGLYTGTFFNSGIYASGLNEYGSLIADDMYYRYGDYDDFTNNAYVPQDVNIESIWSQSYKIIYTANNIIVTLPGVSVISDAQKAEYIAEAKFFRAFVYFYLTNLYGNVPLILTTSVNQNKTIAQSSNAAVLAQIIADLKDTEAALQSSNNPTSKVTEWAAAALLARIYLYTKDWPDAEKEATTVINSGQFQLPTDLNSVFLRSSTESIFHIATNNFDPTHVNFTEIAGDLLPSGGSSPNWLINNVLLNAFEPGDKRKTSWIGSINNNGTTEYYANKYKQNATPANADSAEDFVVMRLAEQFLIRAEARAQQSNIIGSVSDLNQLRTRAGLPNLPNTISSDALSVAVLQERRVELFTEWVHRWFDVNRFGLANQVFGAEKPGFWKPRATLFPIPFAEIQTNSSLVQNPGY